MIFIMAKPRLCPNIITETYYFQLEMNFNHIQLNVQLAASQLSFIMMWTPTFSQYLTWSLTLIRCEIE